MVTMQTVIKLLELLAALAQILQSVRDIYQGWHQREVNHKRLFMLTWQLQVDYWVFGVDLRDFLEQIRRGDRSTLNSLLRSEAVRAGIKRVKTSIEGCLATLREIADSPGIDEGQLWCLDAIRRINYGLSESIRGLATGNRGVVYKGAGMMFSTLGEIIDYLFSLFGHDVRAIPVRPESLLPSTGLRDSLPIPIDLFYEKEES